MTRIGPAGSNIVDDNSFLGHEVGPWKGSESSWRGDELKPTLNPQPVGSGPRLLQGMPQDSFRIADSELSFTEADGSRKAPLHDESFHSGRVPQEYDSSQQQSYANMRSSNGRAVVDDQSHRPGRLLNGSGDRYPPLHNSRPPDIAAGLSLTFLNILNGFKLWNFCLSHIILVSAIGCCSVTRTHNLPR